MFLLLGTVPTVFSESRLVEFVTEKVLDAKHVRQFQYELFSGELIGITEQSIDDGTASDTRVGTTAWRGLRIGAVVVDE